MQESLVVQAAMGDYRQRFLDQLAECRDPRFGFLVGTDYFDGTTETRVESPIARVSRRNVFLMRRRLLWQRGVVAAAVGAGVCVVEYNPRILSNWLILLARRTLRRPTAVWGHAWSRSGRDSRTEVARRRMRRLAGNVLLYTYGQADELAAADPTVRTFVVPNALYTAAEMAPVVGDARDVVFVGRLVESKKPGLLVDAYARYTRSYPDGDLVVVGEGPLREALEKQAADLGVRDRVRFLGHVADPTRIREAYENALCGVSPGYVGLTATQSLGFGVPFVYGDREPHAPEAELLDDTNSRAFPSDDAAALAHVLVELRQAAASNLESRSDVSRATRDRYSAESMARGMIDAVRAIRG